MRHALALSALSLCASVAACAAPSGDDAEAQDDAITSQDAKILDFTFSAEVVAPRNVKARAAIVSQLMYVQGVLTTARQGNAHVGNVKLSDVTETREGSNKRIRYTATLPVAWPKRLATPESYALPLPIDATRFQDFNAKYDGRCGTNEYGRETFWHDWSPSAPGCTIDDADVSRAEVTVTPSRKETQNKYPEYDEIWKDDRLDVVAIFGIISSNTPYDLGYTEAHKFLDASKSMLRDAEVRENSSSSSILEDRTLTGKVEIGGRLRDVKVDVIVVQELKSVGRDFDRRYDALSEKADMIFYDGHAGLGQNVNALARKGKVAAGKYQLVLMNGCQTFAYLDTTIFDRRRDANGAAADPDGTRYLDIVGNALPGWADNLASMSSTLFTAAVRADAPRSYDSLLSEMPSSHIVVAFGEEDNRFTP